MTTYVLRDRHATQKLSLGGIENHILRHHQ